ncbi:polysaccharide export protein EpsE [Duganella fentianensis]|uniref:polysaccharide export protein EpsE n=1 Tax=Duganella fentianensis TaxID=2692177 RepID=UPI0032B30109
MNRLANWVAALLLMFSLNGVSAAEVLLGPGDVLRLSVFGNPDLALETRVNEAGNITFPLIGEVAVAGLSPSLAGKKIGDRLESGGFVRKPQVNVLVTTLQSQQISVLGQVNRPGRYPLEGKRSVIDLLAMAGGISADGGDTLNLLRKRNGVTTKDVVDIIAMMRSGELSQDYELAGGDVVYVERAPRFYVYGEVQRPGNFRLERGLTVVQALSVGGGLTPRGTERGMVIKRRDTNGKLLSFDAKHDDILQPDDVLYVKESWF